MSEEWKDVVGYEGIYQVSTCGNIMRIARGGGAVPGRLLRPGNNKGYRVVKLYSKHGVGMTHKVHALVLAAFVGAAPGGCECNHKNGVKNDNRLENLEWVTRSENCKHRYSVLRRNRPHGDKHGQARLTSKQVDEIRQLYKAGFSQHQIASRYPISRTQVQRIVTGHSRTATGADYA